MKFVFYTFEEKRYDYWRPKVNHDNVQIFVFRQSSKSWKRLGNYCEKTFPFFLIFKEKVRGHLGSAVDTESI